MATSRIPSRPRTLALAVHCVLGFSCAAQAQTQAQPQAPDPQLTELTETRSQVELGFGATSNLSAQAHQYDGVSGSRAYLIGGFELYGGGRYDSDDATRWSLLGSDLDLHTRSLEAEYGVQGRFRIRLGYDELRRNQSDSYQAPYLGVGTNVLMLPSNWITPVIPRLSATTPSARGLSPSVTSASAIVGGVLTPPTAAQTNAANALQAADLPAFRQVDLFTQRKRYGASWEQLLSERWSLTASISNEHKDGLKPQGAHSHATGGDASSILPMPIDQDDHKASVGLSFTGEALQAQASYEVSSFRNNIAGVTWNLWSGPTNVATISTPPSNLFQKLLLSGSYEFTPHTRLVASASYSRNTQNQSFLGDTTAPIVPVASADALVVGESASLKLLSQATKNLNFSAGLKYDLRENRTPVNTYVFYDNNEAPAGVSPFRYLFPSLPNLGTDANIAANTPYSREQTQATVDAEYRVAQGQRLKAGLSADKTRRYCIDTWVACMNAADARESGLHADWFAQAAPELQLQVGAAALRRRVDYNENAFLARVPMAGQFPTGAPAGTTAYDAMLALGLNGYGPVLGLNPAAPAGSALAFYFPLNNALNNTDYGYRNRISELLGMRRYDQADRDRNKLRLALTWQATEKLDLQGGLDYAHDDFPHSTYGLKKASTGALSLDAHYVQSEDFSAGAFATFEEQHFDQAGNSYTANSAAANVNGATAISGGCFPTIAARNANNKIDPCEDWTTSSRDRTATLGASFTKSRLMQGRLSVSGMLAVSEGRTSISGTGGSYVNNPFAGVAGNPTAAIAAFYIPVVPLPAITARSIDVALSGSYQLAPNSSVRVGYGYRRLRASDWGYEGDQDGTLTQVLPTREKAPRYEVHSLGVSFVAGF